MRLDADAGRRAGAVRLARRQVLLAGGRGVAVLHHDQHAVAFVEHVGGDAGDQSVVPEAAVAHHGNRPLRHVRTDRRGAGERHAVAEDRIAERERREGRERMAADVGADMRRPDLALRQLDGGEDRPLRAAGAEIRRPRRNIARRRQARRLMGEHVFDARRDSVGVDPGRARFGQERRDAAQKHFRGVIAGRGKQPLPSTRVAMPAPRRMTLICCST